MTRTINISTSWVMLFIMPDELSDETIEWLDNNAYPITDDDNDQLYDVRTCFDKLSAEDGEELSELKGICKEHKAGFIKLLEEGNY